MEEKIAGYFWSHSCTAWTYNIVYIKEEVSAIGDPAGGN